MKLAALFLVAAAAVDTEAPVISLNLAYNGAFEARKPYKLAKRIVHPSATNHLGQSLDGRSYQDYSVRCTAGTFGNAANVKNCPRPTATAFDHHDGKIKVVERIFLMDMDGIPQNKEIPLNKWNDARYAKRSTYLFKYDATDASGNRADQVVFAMILDDLHAPEITYQGANQDCTDKTTTVGTRKTKCFPVVANQQIVEAASSWDLPKETTAYDNIDGNVTDTLRYAIKCGQGSCGNTKGVWRQPSKNGFESCIRTDTEQCRFTYHNARKLIDTRHVGIYKIEIQAHDFAGIYGHNAKNNVRLHTITLEVKDQRAPIIQVQGTSPKMVECDIAAPVYGEAIVWDKTHKMYQYDSKDCPVPGVDKRSNVPDFCSQGAEVLDILDTVALKGVINEKVTYSGFSKRGNKNGRGTQKQYICGGEGKTCKKPLPVNKVGHYKVHFNAEDNAKNPAEEMRRTVRVADNTIPVIGLGTHEKFGDFKRTKEFFDSKSLPNDEEFRANIGGVTCSDTCSDKVRITSTWSPKEYTPGSPGTYVQTFKCSDDENNSAELARTYIIIDDGEPLLKLNGKDVVTLEASKDAEYTDAGATCTDFADGQIDHQVVVHGDVVNMRVPGTYKIKYNCKDSSGNEAEGLFRSVVVVDTDCPYLKLKGANTRTIEAGFPYVDQGATATDTLDGDLTKQIMIAGGGVTNGHFITERSCQAIKGTGTLAKGGYKAKSGIYNILVNLDGNHAFKQVYCDMSTSPALTLFIHRGHKTIEGDIKKLQMIVPYGNNGGACSLYGMKMAKFNAEEADIAIRYARAKDFGHCPACVEGASKVNGLWAFKPGQKTTDYFCTPRNDDSANPNKEIDHTVIGSEKRYHGANSADLNVAEPGEFVITYMVHDAAGNGAGKYGTASAKAKGAATCTQRSMKKRSVVVKDTLPPVITLFLKNKLIQRSDGGKSSAWGKYDNPASTKTGLKYYHRDSTNGEEMRVGGNPFFDSYMAEQTVPVNGWIIAAAASAVAGVALMATSMKKTATTVPV